MPTFTFFSCFFRRSVYNSVCRSVTCIVSQPAFLCAHEEFAGGMTAFSQFRCFSPKKYAIYLNVTLWVVEIEDQVEYNKLI